MGELQRFQTEADFDTWLDKQPRSKKNIEFLPQSSTYPKVMEITRKGRSFAAKEIELPEPDGFDWLENERDP